MRLEQMLRLLNNAGFITQISGDGTTIVTFARVEGSPETIPLFVSWVPEKGMWKLSSFPYGVKLADGIVKVGAAERLIEVYAALDLIPMFSADNTWWQIGGARYITEEGAAAKAIDFLEAIKTLRQVATKGVA